MRLVAVVDIGVSFRMRRLGGGARGARSRAGESERGNAKRPADALDRPTAKSEDDDRKRETDEEELQLHADMLSRRGGAAKDASSTSSVRVAVLELAARDAALCAGIAVGLGQAIDELEAFP
jgi:hypothetical protein